MTARNCPVQAAVCRDDECRDACELLPAPERPGGDALAHLTDLRGSVAARIANHKDARQAAAQSNDMHRWGEWCGYDRALAEVLVVIGSQIDAARPCANPDASDGSTPQAPTVDSVPPNPDTGGLDRAIKTMALDLAIERRRATLAIVALSNACADGWADGPAAAAKYLSEAEIPDAATPAPVTPPTEDGPHSRACGIRQHDHGPACHANCPTCRGATPPETVPVPRADLMLVLQALAGNKVDDALLLVHRMLSAAGVSGE